MTTKYHVISEPTYRAVLILKPLSRGGKERVQFIGPYNTAGKAKGRITYHRNHVFKQDFIEGWVEVADNWKPIDD